MRSFPDLLSPTGSTRDTFGSPMAMAAQKFERAFFCLHHSPPKKTLFMKNGE